MAELGSGPAHEPASHSVRANLSGRAWLRSGSRAGISLKTQFRGWFCAKGLSEAVRDVVEGYLDGFVAGQ